MARREHPDRDAVAATCIASMPVRSVRLPDVLWRRLEAALAQANRDRRRKVSMSSVLRALLEKALDEPGGTFDFDAKIARPDRVHRDRAAKLAAAQAETDASSLWEQVSEVSDRLEMTPVEFATAVGGDRHEAMLFYHRGALPEGDVLPFVGRVRTWLREHADAG